MKNTLGQLQIIMSVVHLRKNRNVRNLICVAYKPVSAIVTKLCFNTHTQKKNQIKTVA